MFLLLVQKGKTEQLFLFILHPVLQRQANEDRIYVLFPICEYSVIGRFDLILSYHIREVHGTE